MIVKTGGGGGGGGREPQPPTALAEVTSPCISLIINGMERTANLEVPVVTYTYTCKCQLHVRSLS